MRQMAWAQALALTVLVILGLLYLSGSGVSYRLLMLAWMGHALFFFLYIAMLGWAMGRKSIAAKDSWMGFLAALVPLGSIWFERAILVRYPQIR